MSETASEENDSAQWTDSEWRMHTEKPNLPIHKGKVDGAHADFTYLIMSLL